LGTLSTLRTPPRLSSQYAVGFVLLHTGRTIVVLSSDQSYRPFNDPYSSLALVFDLPLHSCRDIKGLQAALSCTPHFSSSSSAANNTVEMDCFYISAEDVSLEEFMQPLHEDHLFPESSFAADQTNSLCFFDQLGQLSFFDQANPDSDFGQASAATTPVHPPGQRGSNPLSLSTLHPYSPPTTIIRLEQSESESPIFQLPSLDQHCTPSTIATEPARVVAPGTKKRKRKATTVSAQAWEPYKEHIEELHVNQGIPLPKVREMIEKNFGFTAEYVIIIRTKRSMSTNLAKNTSIPTTN
jgi:hypothetical protein